METKSSFSRMPAVLLAATLVVAASVGSVWAADPAPAPAPQADRALEHARHRQEWVRARLEREANRLEITASQQTAWQGYASARTALADRGMAKPAPGMDAAALVKMRADRAAEGARKLAALADATARLQSVLSPAQRTTLDQIVRAGHRHARHGGWHRGHEEFDGAHGGHDGLRGQGHDHASGDDAQDAAVGA